MSNERLQLREPDLADVCQKGKTGLGDPANVTAFGWIQTAVAAALGPIDTFLTARAAYGENDFSRNRLAKEAMRDFANTSIRFNKLMKEED
jgi:hypothetical protein